jgi:hypothetical protein
MSGQIVGIGVLVAACTGAYFLARYYARRKPMPRSGLVVAPEFLNLGEVWENKEHLCILPVHNPTDRDIEVLEFRTSCNCVAVAPKTVIIPAGQQAAVRLKLELLVDWFKTTDAAVRDFDVDILPVLRDDFLSQPSWQVTGRVRRSVKIEPPFVQFSAPLVRGRPFGREKVKISALAPAKDLHLRYDKPLLSVQATRQASGSNVFDLTITPASGLACGNFKTEILVGVVPLTGPPLPARAMAADWLVCENIVATPPNILFGAHKVGEPVTEVITLRALHPEDFHIQGIETSSDELCVKPALDATAAASRFLVKQRIGHLGHQSGTIYFQVRRAGNSRTTIPVLTSYFGLVGDSSEKGSTP